MFSQEVLSGPHKCDLCEFRILDLKEGMRAPGDVAGIPLHAKLRPLSGRCWQLVPKD